MYLFPILHVRDSWGKYPKCLRSVLFVKRKELQFNVLWALSWADHISLYPASCLSSCFGEIVGIAAGLFVSANKNKVFSWIILYSMDSLVGTIHYYPILL